MAKILAPVFAVLLLLAGCGDDDDDGSSTGSSEASCSTLQRQFDAAMDRAEAAIGTEDFDQLVSDADEIDSELADNGCYE